MPDVLHRGSQPFFVIGGAVVPIFAGCYARTGYVLRRALRRPCAALSCFPRPSFVLWCTRWRWCFARSGPPRRVLTTPPTNSWNRDRHQIPDQRLDRNRKQPSLGFLPQERAAPRKRTIKRKTPTYWQNIQRIEFIEIDVDLRRSQRGSTEQRDPSGPRSSQQAFQKTSFSRRGCLGTTRTGRSQASQDCGHSKFPQCLAADPAALWPGKNLFFFFSEKLVVSFSILLNFSSWVNRFQIQIFIFLWIINPPRILIWIAHWKIIHTFAKCHFIDKASSCKCEHVA